MNASSEQLFLNSLDPQWAWQSFQPSDSDRWNFDAAAHLVRRASFGADDARIKTLASGTPAQAVDSLLAKADNGEVFEQVSDQMADTLLASDNPMTLSAAWVYRLLFTPEPALENLVLFWHGHFATGADKVEKASLMWQQNRMLRQHAFGDIAAMTQSIAKDPAMLIYLDSVSNRKSHPNENFARELMELFCLGEGNYSEHDVLELARCFTGWEVRNNKFRKNRYQHDSGSKTVLSKTGNFDGEEAVDIVLAQEAMPLFICEKLFRYLIADGVTPPKSLLEQPAELLRRSDLQLLPTLKLMLGSNLFQSSWARHRKIKSPAHLVIGLMRGLKATSNSHRIAEGIREIGQGLFYPPNVKGWAGGRDWINSSTLLGRANLIRDLVRDPDTKFDQGGLSDYLKRIKADRPDAAIDLYQRLMMVTALPDKTRQTLIESFPKFGKDKEARHRGLLHAVASQPTFQLG